MKSIPITVRIREDLLKHIDDLIETRMYKDRPHFIELAVLREVAANDKTR